MTDSESDMEDEKAYFDKELTCKPTLEEQKNIDNTIQFALNYIKYQHNPEMLAKLWDSLKVKL